LLDIPRDVIAAYVATQSLRYVDDESNADPRYRRNGLRGSVVPPLRAMAPGYPRTLVRAARMQAECAELLDDLAALDAASAFDGRSLRRAALRALGTSRASNLLRWFLRQQRLSAPSAARLAQMLQQLTEAADDARVALVHDGVELGIHRGGVFVHRRAPTAYEHPWRGGDAIELPHGTLAFAPAFGSGIARRHLASSRVTIRAGVAGERLRLERRARRAVSDLLREAGVPAWERIALPRLYCDGVLAAVARAGVDAAFAAGRDEASFVLDWRPRS
jgi:tRNA(Ile)-lysidine synthase